MNYSIASLPLFDKQAKRLAKKYPSFKKDLFALVKSIAANPEQGTSLGGNFYKIRLAISSKTKGKSGGARLITYVKISKTIVYLTSIYDKSDKNTITDKELEQIFKMIP